VKDGKLRAGGWFWGPLIWGLFFVVLGVGFLVYGLTTSSTSHDVTSGTTAVGQHYTSDTSPGAFLGVGGLFVLMGLGGLGVAWYVRRDFKSDSKPTHVEADLRSTGVAGQATVKTVSYVARSTSTADGTTLLDLELDVATAQTGSTTAHIQSRAPLETAKHVQVGTNVSVFVNPADPNNVQVDWAALATSTTF
jgi:hypothetical protein